MRTGRKLVVGGIIVAGLTAYMAYRGASASWQYYLTADECAAEHASLAGHRLRVSGRIAAGTLAVDQDRARASFALEGERASLKVVCMGPLPDNLAEGIAVLVEGRVDGAGLLCGEKVLTRCASKYQSHGTAPPAGKVAQKTPENRL
jgi:cytochrome c-type biogenesis protein CcmE